MTNIDIATLRNQIIDCEGSDQAFDVLVKAHDANEHNPTYLALIYETMMRSKKLEREDNFDLLDEWLEQLVNKVDCWQDMGREATHFAQPVIFMPTIHYWLKLKHTDVFKAFDKAQKQVVFMPHYTAVVKDLPDLTPDNYHDYLYKNVPVWSCAIYSVAVSLRCGLADIDVANETHWGCIKGYAGLVASYIDIFEQYLTFFKPQKIIIMQGYLYVAAVQRHMGLIHGVPVVAIENTLHKDKIIYDDISAITVTRNNVRNIFWRTQDHISQAEAQSFATDYVSNIKTLKQSEHKTPAEKLALPEVTHQKTVLYLGQVSTDSSVLFDIVGFNNQAALIAEVAKNVMALGHRLVVKLHPKELHGRDPVKIEPYQQLTYQWLQKYPDFIAAVNAGHVVLDADNAFDTFDLINHADLCVTINSQTGLEAAIMGREVVLCGRAFYGALGFTHDAQGKGDLADTLRRLLSDNGVDEFVNINPMLAQKFFFSFMNYSCLPKTSESLVALS